MTNPDQTAAGILGRILAALAEPHLSLLCELQSDRPHRPCSGTCDCCATPRRCECACHAH